jgi:hypothetical protein
VAERASAAADLTKTLERLRLEQAGARSTSEVAQAQIDLMLARIASLTDVVRSAESQEAFRLACRLLLADLALVAAQFRGRANELAEALDREIEGIRAVMDSKIA